MAASSSMRLPPILMTVIFPRCCRIHLMASIRTSAFSIAWRIIIELRKEIRGQTKADIFPYFDEVSMYGVYGRKLRAGSQVNVNSTAPHRQHGASPFCKEAKRKNFIRSSSSRVATLPCGVRSVDVQHTFRGVPQHLLRTQRLFRTSEEQDYSKVLNARNQGIQSSGLR